MKHFFLFIFLVPSLYLSAQDKAHPADSIFSSLYAKNKFNGNVLLAENGKIVFQKSYGIANEKTNEPLSENSVFELASVSKQFTAMAIMMLKEKGKLALDDSIGKYIPELGFYGNVTIRNLLNHTGGLPDYMDMVMNEYYPKKQIATNGDMIRLFAQQKPAKIFSPGTKYEYSNTGYALLASVIMRVSGMSYGEFLQKNIFAPLKMTNSLVYTRRYAPHTVNNYAFGYVYSATKKKWVLPDEEPETEVVIWLDGIVGDGSVNSTTNDLLKWDRALYTNKLVSAAGMKEIFAPVVLPRNRISQYGMGWSLDSTKNCGRFVSHTGGWPGYATYIERQIDNDKTIIILDNHGDDNFPFFAVRKILYGQSLTPKKRQEITLAPEKLPEYEGEYELSETVSIKIFMQDGKLKTQLTGQSAFDIFAESADNFFLKVVDAQLEFVRDANGKIIKLILHQNGRNQQAYKK